jgi:uncharacterized protein YjhX (UPF0386 family)
MKIGELAARANLNASAIRYYEKLGLLAAPQRLGGQRRYSSDALSRVLLIRFATDMGFTLAEIKLNIVRSLKLKSLLHGLLRCRCVSLQQCVRALGLSENLRTLSCVS